MALYGLGTVGQSAAGAERLEYPHSLNALLKRAVNDLKSD